MKSNVEKGPLSAVRALDLTNEKGYLCGAILAELGAGVIKIEPPGGDKGRNTGPFYHNIPDPEKSLFWFAYNHSKKSITLNIESRDGQEIFKRLVQRSQFVLESFPPGYMKGLDLDYSALSAVNPGIIVTSITPFGQAGPYEHYQAPDIVGMAMGGLMHLTGDADRPPVRIGFPQAYLHASGEAAVGTLMAYYHAQRSGKGQHVDVSMQESLVWTMLQARSYWPLNHLLTPRSGAYWYRPMSRTSHRQTWPCKDGYVAYTIMSGKGPASSNRSLAAWMDSEGMGTDHLRQVDWDKFDMGIASQEELEKIVVPIEKFFLSHTKAELYSQAIKRNIMICPVESMGDLLDNEQLEARNFWQTVEYPGLKDKVIYPGAFARLSGTPLRPKTRAPLIGEHNVEIYETEMDFTGRDLGLLKQAGII